MARIWADGGGAILRAVREAQAGIGAPPGATAVLAFDEDTNPLILAGIADDQNAHRLVAGVLTRNGVAYVIAADGLDKQDRDALGTLVGQLQTYLGVPSPTAAQTTAAVRVMARVLLFVVRRVRL